MFANSKFDIDILDSLPLRESMTTYLKHNPTIYYDYIESKSIHFNKSYKKYDKILQKTCVKFVNQPVQNLAKYLLSIKTKNKYEKKAIDFVYKSLYGHNTYNNHLKYIKVVDGFIRYKNHLSRKTRWKKEREQYKESYKYDYNLTDGGKLVYRHNCYFYLIKDKDCYTMDYKGNTVFVPSEYLQLNKKELKHFKISND